MCSERSDYLIFTESNMIQKLLHCCKVVFTPMVRKGIEMKRSTQLHLKRETGLIGANDIDRANEFRRTNEA